MNNNELLETSEERIETIESIDTMVMEVPTNVACDFLGSIGIGTGNAGQPQITFKIHF